MGQGRAKLASISAFSLRLARFENGKSARLRARRIREHITMSLSGPVPRSHSPDVFVRSSRVMRGILRAQQVAQPRGFLVIFTADGLAQPGPQPQPFRGALAPPRRLAHVPGRSVVSLQERHQSLRKDPVVLGTAEPPARSEFHELDAAVRA